MVILFISSGTEGTGGCTGKIIDHPSYILDIGRESDLDVVHLVLFSRLILDNCQ